MQLSEQIKIHKCNAKAWRQCKRCSFYFEGERCKSCTKEAARKRSIKWRNKYLEYSRAHTRAWKARKIQEIGIEAFRKKTRDYANKRLSIPENRIRHCLGQAKRRAMQKGMEFSISIKDLMPIPTICPILGVVLNFSGTGNKRGFVHNSPSVDRIDSSKGYIKGNVRIISWRANRIKADGTLDELRKIVAYLESCS